MTLQPYSQAIIWCHLHTYRCPDGPDGACYSIRDTWLCSRVLTAYVPPLAKSLLHYLQSILTFVVVIITKINSVTASILLATVVKSSLRPDDHFMCNRLSLEPGYSPISVNIKLNCKVCWVKQPKCILNHARGGCRSKSGPKISTSWFWCSWLWSAFAGFDRVCQIIGRLQMFHRIFVHGHVLSVLRFYFLLWCVGRYSGFRMLQ